MRHPDKTTATSPAPVAVADRSQGLSLIECLAAVAILGTAIVAGLAMFGMHETLASSETQAAQGYLLLEREVDRTLWTTYSELSTTSYSAFDDATGYETCRVVTDFRADVKSVEVFVRWPQDNGGQREHSATVLVWEGN